MALAVEVSSEGTITVMPGSEQARATSSIPIWLGPSSPIEIPECEPTSLTLWLGKVTDMRIWS